MKIFIHTSRYGLEDTLVYHCQSVEYHAISRVLHIFFERDVKIDLQEQKITLITDTLLYPGENDIVTFAPCQSECPYAHANHQRPDIRMD